MYAAGAAAVQLLIALTQHCGHMYASFVPHLMATGAVVGAALERAVSLPAALATRAKGGGQGGRGGRGRRMARQSQGSEQKGTPLYIYAYIADEPKRITDRSSRCRSCRYTDEGMLVCRRTGDREGGEDPGGGHPGQVASPAGQGRVTKYPGRSTGVKSQDGGRSREE